MNRIARSVDFFDPRPEPAPGCMVCVMLVRWHAYYTTGPQRDESAAVDCVIKTRNHPHRPPKMTIKAYTQPLYRPEATS